MEAIGWLIGIGICWFFGWCLYCVFQGAKSAGELLGDHWDHVEERKRRERAQWREDDKNKQ